MLTPFDLKVKSTAHAITLIHPKYWVPNFLKGPATVHQKQAMIPTEENQKRVEELILSISLPPAPKESEDVITPKQSVEFTGSGKNRRERFETKMRFTRSLERMVAFDPNADALFPGSIVQGRGLRDGLLIPIACDRDPVLITITDLALEEGALPYEKVDNPSLATVMGAIDRIRNGKIQKSQPARLTFTIIAANSIEEGFLRLGANANWASGHVRGEFSRSDRHVQSRFMVRYVQSYYSVSCDAPRFPADFFSKAKCHELQNYIYAGNPPAYVSSVTYGREMWLLVESDFEAEEMKVALEAGFQFGFGSGAVDFSEEHKKMLSESSIQAIVIGGAGPPAVKLLMGDKLKSLESYLRQGANFSARSHGVIISYACRYLKDNSLALVSAATDYTVNSSIDAATPPIVLVSGLFQFHTGDQDKDDDNQVGTRFTLENGTIIHQNRDIPPSQLNRDNDPTWHNNTNNPPNSYFYVPFETGSIDTDEHNSITVTISKTGGETWKMGFTFIVVDSVGNQYVIGSFRPNSTELGDGKNEESWMCLLPKRQ